MRGRMDAFANAKKKYRRARNQLKSYAKMEDVISEYTVRVVVLLVHREEGGGSVACWETQTAWQTVVKTV